MDMSFSLVRLCLGLPTEEGATTWGYALSGQTGMDTASVHNLLQQMVAEGWVEIRTETRAEKLQTENASRPPRRLVLLTPEGHRQVARVLRLARYDSRFSALFSNAAAR
jgi:DNA-binding PadR family transcriptional regulator